MSHIEEKIDMIMRASCVGDSPKSVSLKQFEEDTALALVVFVDMASEQLWSFFEHAPNAKAIDEWHKSDRLFDAISNKMLSVYSNNSDFRKKCQAEDPRAHVRMFVQHWVASEFIRQFPGLKSKIPNDFLVGAPLPETSKADFGEFRAEEHPVAPTP